MAREGAIHKRMYKDSPRLKRDEETGKIGVSRASKDASEVNSGTDKEISGEGMPHEARHAMERHAMKDRHHAEHSELHRKHEHEHHMEHGDKTEMHGRHHEELKHMHKKHEGEMKALHGKHEKEMHSQGKEKHGGTSKGEFKKDSGSKEINRVEKDEEK